MTRHTKHGFPTVHELDLKSVAAQPVEGKAARKSLFAQQFESHGPEYFGIEFQASHMTSVAVDRDRVEPISLYSNSSDRDGLSSSGMAASQLAMESGEGQMSDLGRTSTVSMETTPSTSVSMATGATSVAQVSNSTSAGDSVQVVKEQFASKASQAWDKFLKSRLISGEGLTSMGVSREAAQEEVTKIHQENVERLSNLPEKEIMEEQERIKQVLGKLH